MIELYLASASPRRKALLEQIGLSCVICPVDADESILEGEMGGAYVERLAKLKANMALSKLKTLAKPVSRADSIYLIGSDTSVVVDGFILGKPFDQNEFFQMMRRLSGKAHEVLTGVCVLRYDVKADKVLQESLVVSTEVNFKQLSDAEIEAYWASGEPADKAGGYGIQGLGAVFVSGIRGSYSNVVGLPVSELKDLLVGIGFDYWGSLAVTDQQA